MCKFDGGICADVGAAAAQRLELLPVAGDAPPAALAVGVLAFFALAMATTLAQRLTIPGIARHHAAKIAMV